MSPKILYKFASRSRPKKFLNCVDRIKELSTESDYLIWGSFDTDDESMNNGEFLAELSSRKEVRPYWGISTGKINAINRDMRLIDELGYKWDICIVWSDDMLPLVSGFDTKIVESMLRYFPDYDGVIHFPDSHARFDLITLSILGRRYYERFDFLYNPEYYSVFADNEFTDVSRMLNKYAFIPEKIMDHFHFIWGMCEKDTLYERNENKNNYYKDNQTYLRRKSDWFGLNLFK